MKKRKADGRKRSANLKQPTERIHPVAASHYIFPVFHPVRFNSYTLRMSTMSVVARSGQRIMGKKSGWVSELGVHTWYP